ncbi:hypothetical protein MJK72_20705 [Klebsiella pneumoniae]|nr:hypothetical protein MJK72_20705 [Klebsiella pneumoniae]
MVGNKTLIEDTLARIKSYHDYGTFTPLQVAAIAAHKLEGDPQCVRDIAEQYKRRRDVLVKGLHEAGWMVECPKSVYVRVGENTRTLRRHGVAGVCRKSCLMKRRFASRRGLALATMGISTSASR